MADWHPLSGHLVRVILKDEKRGAPYGVLQRIDVAGVTVDVENYGHPTQTRFFPMGEVAEVMDCGERRR